MNTWWGTCAPGWCCSSAPSAWSSPSRAPTWPTSGSHRRPSRRAMSPSARRSAPAAGGPRGRSWSRTSCWLVRARRWALGSRGAASTCSRATCRASCRASRRSAIDLRVLGVAVLSALVTGLLVGLAPAALHLRPRLAEATSSGGSRTTRGRGAKRIGNALVVGEVALASLLLVGAGLFVASFARLMRIDPGYDYRHVLALGITTPDPTAQMAPRDEDAARQRGRAMIEQVSSAVRAVPGVLGAEAVDAGAPLSGVRFPWAIVLSGGDSLMQVLSRQNSARPRGPPCRHARVPGAHARPAPARTLLLSG